MLQLAVSLWQPESGEALANEDKCPGYKVSRARSRIKSRTGAAPSTPLCHYPCSSLKMSHLLQFAGIAWNTIPPSILSFWTFYWNQTVKNMWFYWKQDMRTVFVWQYSHCDLLLVAAHSSPEHKQWSSQTKMGRTAGERMLEVRAPSLTPSKVRKRRNGCPAFLGEPSPSPRRWMEKQDGTHKAIQLWASPTELHRSCPNEARVSSGLRGFSISMLLQFKELFS